MFQASVRNTDRVVTQTGTALGERVDCSIIEVGSPKDDELRAALATSPRGNVHLSATLAITVDPYIAAVLSSADQAALDQYNVDRARVQQFMQAVDGAPTDAQRDAALKSFMRMVRYRIQNDLV